jgi:PRC-barrel domain
MLKKLLLTTALSGLMLSSAMAQSPSPGSSPGSGSPPAAATPPASSSDTMKSDAPKSSASDAMKSDAPKPAASASTSGASGSAQTVSSQKPDQLLASKVRGADVVGSDDKKIGDVSDILFSKDGKIEAYVLSVGGFLGVGAKEVALAPSSIQMTQDKDTWKLKVSMTKDQLAQAPNFERHQDRSTTTGAGGTGGAGGGSATTPRSAPGGGMAPSGGSGAK